MAFFGGGGASVDLASPPAIGNTTPNTGAFTTLSANNGTITTSSPAFTLAQTWNAGAQTFTALRVNATDTASASGSLLIDLQVGGISRLSVRKDSAIVFGGAANTTIDPALLFPTAYGTTVKIYSDINNGIGIVSQGNTTFIGNSVKVEASTSVGFSWKSGASNVLSLLYDADNVLAQRRSTNAQTFRLYNTFTDASNYERVDLRWTSNTFEINTRNGAAGTGTARNVHITIPNNGGFLINGGFGGGELFAIRNSNMGTAYGVEIAATGWRSAIRCLNFYSDRGISWSNSTSSLTTADCAIVRNSAGVIEINDGNTTGTFRDLIVRNFRMSAPTGVPTANNSTGTEGSIRWDADYIYICTATNTWKRVAIATWP